MATETDPRNQFDLIPRTPNTLARQDLFDLLDAYAGYRVVLVTAPPGYGKTTLIADFLRQRGVPAAWHTLDDRDRDLPGLYQNVLRALRPFALTEALSDGPTPTPKECAEGISGLLREHIRGHFFLVLDDLQTAVGSVQVEAWLKHLVELLPPHIHLALISRTLPDLPIAELIARRAVLAIGHKQLRFSADEAAALAQRVGSIISADQIAQRTQQLEGWPAGVAIALQPLPEEVERSLLQGQYGPEALFNSLAALLMVRQPPVLRDFLTSSAVLRRMTPELCRKVLGYVDGDALLHQVQSRGLFITQVGGGFSYHRLFRDFLQDELRRINPQRYAALHQSAAEWFAAHGDLELAFEHHLAAGQVERALALVRGAHMALYTQGHIETLLKWRALLEDDARHVPELVYKCALIHTDRYRFDDAEAELMMAGEGFAAVGDRVGLGDVTMQRCLIALMRGAHADVIALADPVADDDALPARLRARATHYLGMAHLGLGEIMTALDLLEAVAPIYEAEANWDALAAVLQDTEVAYTRLGWLDESSRCLQRVVVLRRQLGRADALALALNNLGYHYHQRHQYQEAIAALEEGLAVIAETTSQRARSYLLWSLGDVRRDLGDYTAAQTHYDQAHALSAGFEPWLQHAITLSMSTLLRWQGFQPLAERLACEVSAAGTMQGTADQLAARVRLWMAHAHHGDPAGALAALRALLDTVDAGQAGPEHKLGLLFCAHAALLAGDAPASAAHLRQLEGLQADARSPLSPELVGEIARSPRLHAFITAHGHYPLIQAALASHQILAGPVNGAEASHQADSARTIYSIRVMTLGHESIEHDGLPVLTGAWRAHRAREFFLYLLFNGAQTRDQICVEFWPESSSSEVRSNFHTTIYRARQALGENAIVLHNEQYMINPALDLYCDARLFETRVKQALNMPLNNGATQDLYHKALQLYRGDFLTSLDTTWVVIHREHLRELYLRALAGKGQCALNLGDPHETIRLAQSILRIDAYKEEAYRMLFRAHARLGESSKVLAVYREMEHIFRDELGITPSQETIHLMQQLIQNKALT